MTVFGTVTDTNAGRREPENILLVIMDDIGPEQLMAYDANPGQAYANSLASGGCDTNALTTTQVTAIDSMQAGPNLFTNLNCGSPNCTYNYACTPELTRLASEGVRFSRAFGSPLCSPTRAQIQTGRYPFRNGIGGIVLASGRGKPNPDANGLDLAQLSPVQIPVLPQLPQLPDSEYTFAEALRFSSVQNLGTGYVGKWHLAADIAKLERNMPMGWVPDGFHPSQWTTAGDDHPVTCGWSFFDGILRGVDSRPKTSNGGGGEGCNPERSGSYFDYFRVSTVGPPVPYIPCLNPLFTPPASTSTCYPNGWSAFTAPAPMMSTNRERESEYLVTNEREALQSFITSSSENSKPWVAVWATFAPHTPLDYPPSTLHTQAPTQPNENDSYPRFRAILQAFDTEFGKLRTALEALGEPGSTVWDNTLVLVVSDNGTQSLNVLDADIRGPGSLDGYILPSDEANPAKRRFKGAIYNSGCNLALIAAGPGVEGTRGRVSNQLVDSVDLFTTILDFAGVDVSGSPQAWTLQAQPAMTPENPLGGFEVDGFSLRPVLASDGGSTARDFCFSHLYWGNGHFQLRNPNVPPMSTPTSPLAPNPADRCQGAATTASPCDNPVPLVYEDIGYIYTAKNGSFVGHTFRLVRRQGAVADEFYHLWDDLGAPVDVAEAVGLQTDSLEYIENYPAALAELSALLPPPWP